MEKLKAFLNKFDNYLFWPLAGIIIVVALLFWFLSKDSLAKAFGDRKTEITGKFSGVQSVASIQGHPEGTYIASVRKEHDVLKKKVFDAWNMLYQEQKAKNTWPEVLGKDFISYIENLPPGKEIDKEYRRQYQIFIEKRIPELMKIIDHRHTVPNDEKNTTALNQEDELVGVVDWSGENLSRWEERFNWSTTPSDTVVRCAQEEIWVLKSILEVIKTTNGDEKDHLRAAIKKIDSIDIGADANRAWKAAEGSVIPSTASPAPMMMGAALPTTATAAPNLDQKFTTERYVDDKGLPLAAEGTQPFAEYKMMPLSMRIVIDQRKLPELLANCANSAMPIEVRNVRLWPEGGDGGKSSSSGGPSLLGGAGKVTGGMPMIGGPMLGGSGGGRAVAQRTSQGDDSKENKSTFDIPVEIHGIIYIYNPPDKEKLGTGGAALEAAAAAKGETTPAAGTKTETAPETKPETTPATEAKPETTPPASGDKADESTVPKEVAPKEEATPAGPGTPDSPAPGVAPTEPPPAQPATTP